MARVSLKMISIGSLLLIFNDRSSSSAPCSPPSSDCSSRCITEDQFLKRVEKLQERSRDLVPPENPSPDSMTCAQAAKEMRGDLKNRSVSPWKYRKDWDENRFPSEIQMAECLCQGCIINHREDHSYNSVPVYAVRMVLKRTECHTDKNKYMVEKDFIRVPVACTCALPKIT